MKTFINTFFKTTSAITLGLFISLGVNAEELPGIPGDPDEPMILEGTEEHEAAMRELNYGIPTVAEARVAAAKERIEAKLKEKGVAEPFAEDLKDLKEK